MKWVINPTVVGLGLQIGIANYSFYHIEPQTPNPNPKKVG